MHLYHLCGWFNKNIKENQTKLDQQQKTISSRQTLKQNNNQTNQPWDKKQNNNQTNLEIKRKTKPGKHWSATKNNQTDQTTKQTNFKQKAKQRPDKQLSTRLSWPQIVHRFDAVNDIGTKSNIFKKKEKIKWYQNYLNLPFHFPYLKSVGQNWLQTASMALATFSKELQSILSSSLSQAPVWIPWRQQINFCLFCIFC